VRDLDAHSWVEAWFPGIGWVVFDPTPSTAPPRSQASGTVLPSAGLGDARDLGQTRQALGTGQVADPSKRPPWGWIALAALVATAVFLGGRGLVRRNRALRAAPATSELERALRMVGEGLAPATTLAALEARYAATPGAPYLSALKAQRYAPVGRAPTSAQRRGLRRALARGAGPLGRLRALRALPPRLRKRG
jgi:hypothetical protein